MNIANNFNEFVEKVSQAERTALNTEAGQKITKELLKMALQKNPNMTSDEWKQVKSDFMTFVFCKFVQECPEAMKELAMHTYNELTANA